METWTIDSMETFVLAKESTILANSNLLQEERNSLLAMTSVFAHSCNYWNDHPILGGGERRWWVIAGCDAFGGLVGFSLFGPVGAAAGAAIGSGGAAIFHSVKTGFDVNIAP